MKRILVSLASLMIIFSVFGGVASAKYQPQNDISINLKLPVNLPNLGTGSLTFGLQQTVQQTLTQTTGLSVDYFYIWVNVNDVPVAAIDPAKAMV
ncbi:hypothetical protein D7Z26_17105 [Cohnella endophytica]|uniref:Uncharacterized protein n=1 Tax=Cohnella endophytica TaxID=2419778 RepID=A0A494XLB7_9BACL|nr:hypothetical protein [Cohnella endophytica]RKP51505.1 hypothetical protein D7Z26_17105 [Cohnella endophytica]